MTSRAFVVVYDTDDVVEFSSTLLLHFVVVVVFVIIIIIILISINFVFVIVVVVVVVVVVVSRDTVVFMRSTQAIGHVLENISE